MRACLRINRPAGIIWLLLLAGLMVLPPVERVWASEELVVYSGRGEKFTRPVLAAFRASTGIRTQSLVSSAGSLLARIQEEGGRTQADIFMSNSAGVLEKARESGLLQPYASPMLRHIPPEFIGPGNHWVGVSARARAVVYNKELVDPALIGSTFDLARPEWKGKLGITVSTNGSFIGGVTAMLSHYDEEAVRRFLVGIKSNAGENIFPKHTPVVSAVKRGEIALGWINHYYFYRAISKEPRAPLGIVFPDQESSGTPVTLSGVAIIKHGKNQEAARKFIDFVLSPEGQRIFAEVNFEFPVRDDVAAHPLLPDRKQLKMAPVGSSMRGELIDRAVALIRKAGMH